MSLLPWLRRTGALLGPFVALIVLLAAIRLAAGPTFWGWANLQNIATQTVIVAVGAIGMTVIIVAGGIDLSCGAALAFAAVLCARVLAPETAPDPQASLHERWWAWLAALPDWSAIPVAILAGTVVGLTNGGLIAGLGQLPFIVTLGMMGVARGAAKWQADSQSVVYDSAWLPALMARPPAPEPGASLWSGWPTAPAVLIALALAAATALLMRATVFGRHVYAIGSNAAAARLCGIRVGWTTLAVYAFGGACFGLAGALSAGRLSQGDPTTAMGYELDVIAAVIVGGASLSGGSGGVLGSVLGALLMTVLRNGAQQLEWETYVQEIMIGAAIVVAALIDRLRARRA
jgi:ribose transport system permease protein